MRYEEWEPVYLEILGDFGYKMEDDLRAAETLLEILRSAQIQTASADEVDEMISGEDYLIIGPCTTVEVIARGGKTTNGLLGGKLLATVGEGTRICMEAGIVPQLVFTDLDGFPEFDLLANQDGAMTFIHAHGDNIPELMRWGRSFIRRTVPTCQCRPPKGAFNWGGFTDGDRAFCTLRHYRARAISLLGFDFANPCGTKEADWETKRRKLRWAEKIIQSQSLPEML